MPCNRIAVVTCQVNINLADILAYEGAIDALVASLTSLGHTVTNVRQGRDSLSLTIDDATIIAVGKSLTGGTRSLQEVVKSQLEALNSAVTVEVVARQIEALTRTSEREYNRETGALLLNVEV